MLGVGPAQPFAVTSAFNGSGKRSRAAVVGHRPELEDRQKRSVQSTRVTLVPVARSTRRLLTPVVALRVPRSSLRARGEPRPPGPSPPALPL